MSEIEPTDDERYPLLGEAGKKLLRFMREHPAAPIFRNQSGNRLSQDDLDYVRSFERRIEKAAPRWEPGEKPAFLGDFVAHALMTVPFYRRYARTRAELEELPTFTRAELGRDIAAFVPDDVPLDRVINFRTSGTTGHPLLIASHPRVAASYLAFHKKALSRFGVELRAGAGEVGVVLVGFQKKCFTYVSVTPQMGESGLVKLNLHPDDWRDPDDRARYLDALDPEMYTGDPIAFAELAKLSLATKPRALLSTSMTLLPEMRALLERRFECPVVDVYSLNEAGPIAFSEGETWPLLQPEMFVEILDPAGNPLAPGARGEITLSGGFNPFLPLVRYRTGDFGALVFHGGEPRLSALTGRAPVRFRATNGSWLNNIDVTHALGRFALAQWSLSQNKDGGFELRTRGGNPRELRGALAEIFGADARIEVVVDAAFDDKVRQYTSELE